MRPRSSSPCSSSHTPRYLRRREAIFECDPPLPAPSKCRLTKGKEKHFSVASDCVKGPRKAVDSRSR